MTGFIKRHILALIDIHCRSIKRYFQRTLRTDAESARRQFFSYNVLDNGNVWQVSDMPYMNVISAHLKDVKISVNGAPPSALTGLTKLQTYTGISGSDNELTGTQYKLSSPILNPSAPYYLTSQYPLYSGSDEALWLMADSWRRMGDRFENQEADALTRIVKDYPLSEHVDGAKEQLTRDPHLYPLPQIQTDNFTSIFDWKYDDTKLLNYQSHPKISFEIAV